jgi:hypothetical protein
MSVDAVGLGAIAAGSVFLYAGIKGISATAALGSIVRGTSPASVPVTAPITAPATPAPAGTASIPAGAGVSQYQKYAFSLFPQFGWGTDQQQPLISLWNQESGWNPTAQNPTSTAYGIAQFLDTTWGPYGPKTSDPGLQIQYGLQYIRDRYGAPSMAWAHEQLNNWY